MNIFKIKDRWRCPSTMTVKSVAGIVLGEFACQNRANHEGPHRGQNGMMWDNHGKRMENFEKQGDKPNKPLIFLGR